MRILVITPIIPYPLTNGYSLIVYNVFKELAVRHEIYLLSFLKNPEDKDNLIYLKEIFKDVYLIESDRTKRSFFRYLKNVLSWNSGFLMKEQCPRVYFKFKEKMIDMIFSKNIDLVHCRSLFMAEFVRDLDLNKCIKVLHLVDSNALALKREINLQNSRKWFQRLHNIVWYYRVMNYEKNVMRNFDLNITVGKKDFEVLKSLSPNANIALIPNGVDTNFFIHFRKNLQNIQYCFFQAI